MTRLSARVKKAKSAIRFTAILTRDKNDKVKTLLVPGTDGKRYHIILRRNSNGSKISTECRLQVGNNGHRDCPGNSNGTVCYHSMAAILKVSNGYKVSVCGNLENANRLAQMGGKVGALISHQGKGKLFLVIQKG